MSETPELGNLKGEQKSDVCVLFVVEGQTIPALKSVLTEKSRVFRAMFSEESKYEEVVIEDTTYEAFNTFIRFLNCDHLVLKDKNDFQLIQELYKLSERYDVPELDQKIADKLYEN